MFGVIYQTVKTHMWSFGPHDRHRVKKTACEQHRPLCMAFTQVKVSLIPLHFVINPDRHCDHGRNFVKWGLGTNIYCGATSVFYI